jgi:hypothetical protein
MGSVQTENNQDLLADALEALIAKQVDTLEGFAVGLNELNVRAPRGQRWTVELLAHELARLGSSGA